MAVIMGVVAPAAAGPAPAQSGSLSACVNEAIVRISAEAARLPAQDRGAYISAQVALARTRCGAIYTGTATPTSTTTTTAPTSTTTTTTTTTTPPTTTTTTTSPSTTTITTAPGRYEITVFGVVGVGSQTLEANCRTGDRLVSYRYEVPRPTGSNTSRSVSVDSNGRGVRLTYEVVGSVAVPRTSLTIVCRTA